MGKSLAASARRGAAWLLSKSAIELTSASATAVWVRPLMWARGFASSNRRSHAIDTYNILVVRLDGIGDVVMTGPFLRELRRAYPGALITLIVAPQVSNLVEQCPHVDRVLTLRLPPGTRWWRPLSRRWAALSFARRHLWREGYDLAIVPRWGEDLYEAAVLAFLSGAPRRVGYLDHSSAGEQKQNAGLDRFLTQVVDDRSLKHEVQRNLDLLLALGVVASDDRLEVWLSDEDQEAADQILASLGPGPLVALAVGAGVGRGEKIWPIERFVEVGQWLKDRGFGLVVVGGAGEERLGEELRRCLGSGLIDLTNRTSLRQTVAVLCRCSLFCGNNAGPMHLAAAAGVPIVEVSCHSLRGDDFHQNSAKRFGPWGVPNRIVRPEEPQDGCVPGCWVPAPHCILNVRADSVIDAIASLWDETAVLGGSVDAP